MIILPFLCRACGEAWASTGDQVDIHVDTIAAHLAAHGYPLPREDVERMRVGLYARIAARELLRDLEDTA